MATFNANLTPVINFSVVFNTLTIFAEGSDGLCTSSGTLAASARRPARHAKLTSSSWSPAPLIPLLS